MDYGTAECLTFIFLITFFCSLEVYNILRRREGRLISFTSPDIPLGDLLGASAKVRMKDGEIVDAEMSGCTLCIGRFEVGDKVYLCKNRDKYVVNLPLFMKTQRKESRLCTPSSCQKVTRKQHLRAKQG